MMYQDPEVLPGMGGRESFMGKGPRESVDIAGIMGGILQNQYGQPPAPEVEDPLDEKHQAQTQKEANRQQALLQQVKSTQQDPSGVLTVHIREARFFNLDPGGKYMRDDVSIYLRVGVASNIRCTHIYESVLAPTNVIFDELKHLPVRLSPTRTDPSNLVHVDIMVAYPEKPETHHVLSVKEFHMYDIIKHLYAVQTIPMRYIEKLVAEVELEFCFTYGFFGYGFSNQLENRQKTPKDQIAHSLFVRVAPPCERNDGTHDVMTPAPMGHPGFINFTQKVTIGKTANEFKEELQQHDVQKIEEPTLVVSKIRKKLHRYQEEYSTKETRKERLQYLHDLINGHCPAHEATKLEFEVPANFKLKKRQIKRQRAAAMPANQEHDPGSTTEIADQLAEMVHVLGVAPGIRRRSTRRDTDADLIEQQIIAPAERGNEAQAEEDAKPQKKSLWGRLFGRVTKVRPADPEEGEGGQADVVGEPSKLEPPAPPRGLFDVVQMMKLKPPKQQGEITHVPPPMAGAPQPPFSKPDEASPIRAPPRLTPIETATEATVPKLDMFARNRVIQGVVVEPDVQPTSSQQASTLGAVKEDVSRISPPPDKKRFSIFSKNEPPADAAHDLSRRGTLVDPKMGGRRNTIGQASGRRSTIGEVNTGRRGTIMMMGNALKNLLAAKETDTASKGPRIIVTPPTPETSSNEDSSSEDSSEGEFW